MRQRLLVLVLCLSGLFVGAASAAPRDTATQLPFTSAPVWLAVDPAGQHVFVSGGPGTSLIVVLNFDGTIAKTITGEGGASQMALDPATHTLYVALHDATAISEIDTTTLTETTRFSTAPYTDPSSIVIAGGKLWFSCTQAAPGGCVVSAGLDGSGMALASLTGIGVAGSWTAALASGGSDDHLLAVEGEWYPSAVAIYDVSSGSPSLISSVAFGGNPNDMTFDSTGANLLLADGSQAVLSLSTSDLLSSAQYPIGQVSVSTAASGNGYVAAGRATFDSPDVAVYPAGDTTPVRTWSLETQDGMAAHALAFSPDASRLFAVVKNSATGHMDFHVLAAPTVTPAPTTVSLSPAQQTIDSGHQATLTAHVTGTSSGTVDLYDVDQNLPGGKMLVATSLVNGSGNASFSVSPTGTTTYDAVLEEGDIYASSTSPQVTVTVRAATAVTLSSSQQGPILAGTQITLTVDVTGTSLGTIDLYGTPNGGVKGLVATIALPSDSFYVSPSTTTTYTVVLEAGSTWESSTSNDVTVTVIPLSMQIAASQHTVPYGGQISLTLTGVKAGTVDLFGTPNGQGQALLKAVTVAAGKNSVTVTLAPQRATTYFAEREDQAAASNSLRVYVRPLLVFAVHAKLVSPQVVRRHGEKVVLGAIRKPALPGEPLVLEIDKAQSHGGWKIVALGNVPVGASGIFAAVLTVKKTGLYRARVLYPSDGNYVSVRSPFRRFRVG